MCGNGRTLHYITVESFYANYKITLNKTHVQFIAYVNGCLLETLKLSMAVDGKPARFPSHNLLSTKPPKLLLKTMILSN